MQATHLLKPTLPIAALRFVVSIIFILHAAARIYNNFLPGFGNFLETKGFPSGYYLAWAVTVFELAGGALLFFRQFVILFCIGEIIILITGIVLIHWQNGWFVSDMSLGGAENSVVLITILFAIFFAERKAEKNITPVL